MTTVQELRDALRVAARALEQVSDWDITDVRAHPPKEWGLKAYGDGASHGWCSITQLAKKLAGLSVEDVPDDEDEMLDSDYASWAECPY